MLKMRSDFQFTIFLLTTCLLISGPIYGKSKWDKLAELIIKDQANEMGYILSPKGGIWGSTNPCFKKVEGMTIANNFKKMPGSISFCGTKYFVLQHQPNKMMIGKKGSLGFVVIKIKQGILLGAFNHSKSDRNKSLEALKKVEAVLNKLPKGKKK